MSWLAMPFLRYADFKGRSGRTEFWTFFGLSVAALLLTVVATGLSTDTSSVAQPRTPGANASPAGAIGYMLWWLASIVPWFAVHVRRFHDQGRSGWLCLIGVAGYVAIGFGAMPLAGILFLVVMALMALPGEETENRYGPPVCVGNDYEAAPIERDSSPSDEQVHDFGVAAASPDDALTLLEPHLEVAELQREMPDAEPFPADHANSSGGQASAWSAPISSGAIDTERSTIAPELSSLPDDVSLVEDGRYSCRSYVFNSRSAAVSYSQRHSTPMPALRNANSTELDDIRLRRSTRDRNPAKQEVASHQIRPNSPTGDILNSNRRGNDEHRDPIGSDGDMPLHIPDDVEPLGNGNYRCGGYIFYSRDEAEWHSQRRALAMASIAAAPASSQTQPNGTTLAFNEIEAGIHFGRDGNFYFRGNSYWTIEEARTAKPADLLDQQGQHEASTLPASLPTEHDERAENLASVGAMPPYLSADVKPEGNGRFSCGGYTFNSLEQALSFAKRRNDRSGHSERSVSPFSFVPVSKPPQPSPPKQEQTGFLGSGASAKKQTVAEHWVATPTNLSAGGVPFEGYLVYFGTRPRRQQYERHRSLIDPNLDVSNGRDPQGSTFSYWPNYSELRPEARRSYLEWLSAGRRDPNTPIGYVFIYFYGLERRLVKDRSEADAPAIMVELRRLLAIYGDNHSFKSYCSALLDMGELLFGNVKEIPKPTLDTRYSWELPILLRVYLGRKVSAGQMLDSNDALCWTLGHPLLYPRTPVTRCFAEFCELWKVRFDEQFPKGLSVREPKARLNIQYRSASSEFNETATIDSLPDVGAISGPISKFELLLGSCSEELDPLSRFLGRNPAEKDSAVAGALLPEPLRKISVRSEFGQFSQFLRDATRETGLAELGISEVMAKLGFPVAGKANERRALHLKRLPELFDAAGFGFEPDKRFGPTPSLSEDLKVCVFSADRGGAVNANRPEYLAARTMAEIAALAARADELVVDAEIASITSDLVSFPEISALDRTRLRAHAMGLLANPSKLKAATKRLCELPEKQREAALTSAVRAVLADQRITPSEVRFLEGLYKALGLPQDEVYSRLHSGETSKSALPSARDDAGPEIDHEKLARLKEETSAVSSMLASIFKEEEASAKPVDENPVAEAEIAGLDAAHSGLLFQLTEAPLDTDAFEAICRNHKLLPSGAIETINDWAFDALDDYAIEDGEMICIQEHLIEPIKAMRKAT